MGIPITKIPSSFEPLSFMDRGIFVINVPKGTHFPTIPFLIITVTSISNHSSDNTPKPSLNCIGGEPNGVDSFQITEEINSHPCG